MRPETAARREAIGAAIEALRARSRPGELARYAMRRLEWRAVARATLLIGRTFRDNPVATVVTAVGVGWLASGARRAARDMHSRDLVLVADRNGNNGAPPATERQPQIGYGYRGDMAMVESPAANWPTLFKRTWRRFQEDNASVVAAGVAFYALLAIFPGLAAALSIYGLVADPAGVARQISSLDELLPGQAQMLLERQLNALVSHSGATLGLSVVFGVLLALWSASSGVKAMMTACAIVYKEPERRGAIHYNATALALTLGAIVAGLVTISLVAVLPALLAFLPVPEWLRSILSLGRWPILAIAVMAGIATLYRYGPSREGPSWRLASPGVILATVLWIAVSLLFSWYAANLANYDKTYGSLGAVIALLMWFYITACVVLLGAELNAELKQQSATTPDRRRRLLRDPAAMADVPAA